MNVFESDVEQIKGTEIYSKYGKNISAKYWKNVEVGSPGYLSHTASYWNVHNSQGIEMLLTAFVIDLLA